MTEKLTEERIEELRVAIRSRFPASTDDCDILCAMALRSARSEAAGWVRVPKEPTREHFYRVIGRELLDMDRVPYENWCEWYVEMIAAAPSEGEGA